MTLRELLGKLRDIDDDLLPEEFDPAEVVGDIKDKVDAIKWRLDSWAASAKMIEEEYIKPLKQKQAALLGKAERLKEYVQHQMITNGFEKLPGEMFRVQVQNSPMSVVTKDFANANYYLNYPEFVVQKTTYDWNKEALKDALDKGEVLTFAEIKRGKHVRFYTQGEKK
jgi:hypothetical protein